MSKSVPTNPELAPLEARVDGINQQMAALTARRILDAKRIADLEKADKDPAAVAPGEQDVRDRLSELLGSAAPQYPAGELADLRLDRDAIDRALPILAARAMAASGALVEARTAARAQEWRDLVRRRVFAVIELRKANDAAEAFGKSIASGGVRASLPLNAPAIKLLGGTGCNAGPGLPATEFIEAAVRAGFVTRKEIPNG